MAYQRTVIRFENEGKRVREVVHCHDSEIQHFEAFGKPAIKFRSQIDGAWWILHTENIIEIFVEEEDPKYATFHKVRNIDL